MSHIAHSIYESNPSTFFKWANSPEFDPNIEIEPGIPLWVDCLKNSHLRGMLFLLEQGADLENGLALLKTDKLIGLFLSTLWSYTNKDLLRKVISSGIDLNTLIQVGDQPTFNFDEDRVEVVSLSKPLLSIAATDSEMSNQDIVNWIKVLVQSGADINGVDSTGNTALHDAAAALFSDADGNLPIISTLLDMGANTKVVNQYGLSPRTYFIRFVDKTIPDFQSNKVYSKMCDYLD